MSDQSNVTMQVETQSNDQTINQSTTPSDSQSTTQSTDQTADQTTKPIKAHLTEERLQERASKLAAFDNRMRTRLQSINQIIQARSAPIVRSVKPAIEQSNDQTADHSITSEDQSMDQTTDQSINQPIEQPIDFLSNVQRTTIQEGSVVILYESHQSMTPIKVKRGAIYQSKYGVFPHVNMIGLSYGARMTSKSGSKGFIDLLSVTSELWTRSLSHRTQILYFADIALICFQLNLKPGCVVMESGTGSGSLSVGLHRSIAPTGFLHTFEFNQSRVEKARIDFDMLAIDRNIQVYHRDVCGRGFPQIEGGVDAVFLDLPSPWSVFESAAATMRHGARLASFSPCIEQVQRACERLRELGFTDVRTHEVLLEEQDLHELKMETVPKYGIKTKKQLTQNLKRKSTNDSEDNDDNAVKKQKNDADQTTTIKQETVTPSINQPKPSADPLVRYPAATRGFALARGHTGYLTFATKVNKL